MMGSRRLGALASSQSEHVRQLWRRSASGPVATATSLPDDGLTLQDFISQARGGAEQLSGALPSTSAPGAHAGRRVFIETYGCQMNVNDSEVVHSVLAQAGYTPTHDTTTADVILLNTCAIRDHAESKIWQRLGFFKNMKAQRKTDAKKAAMRQDASISQGGASPAAGPVVGVLGCMAERLKHKLLESDKMVDLVAGPDAYRDLPRLIDIVSSGSTGGSASTTSGRFPDLHGMSEAPPTGSGRRHAINVQLSLDETYADVVPVRPAGTRSAFLSIMRGCNNMCAFCVVPFTRGRERSRPALSIIEEVKMLSDTGVKEITLLGQNVNSYADTTERPRKDSLQTPNFGTSASTASLDKDLDPFEAHYARGFRSVYRPRRDGAVSFAELLDRVAAVDPEIRIRFTSPHPKDFSDEVLAVIASRPNVCKQLHMPAQSGSTAVLQRMRRGYTREAYDALVDHVRASIPGVALSTDMIAGFCGETEADHAASVDLLQSVRYESAFLFAYSERDRTHAARHHADDVPPEAKSRRLQELVAAYREQLVGLGHAEVGRRHLVLVEGASRRSPDALTGRTDTFKRVVFDDVAVPSTYQAHAHALHAGHGTAVGGACGEGMHGHGHGPDSHAVHAGYVRLQPGDYVAVQVVEGGGGTLRAVPLARTTLMEFVSAHGTAVPLEVFPSVQSRGDLGYPLAASAP